MFSTMHTHSLLKMVNNAVIDLPSPSSINTWWNFGSLLGMCLGLQLVSGLFLSMHYAGDVLLAFESVSHIARDVNFGWLMRIFHANGASLFFIAIYMHIGRGVFYSSFSLHETWSVGTVLLLLVMAAAFLGYVLPWGQMSFWGATVITNLFSAIPYIGPEVVNWLWGGFAIDNATLTRFFAFHFLVPFIVVALAGIHLLFLHQTGSNNPLGLSLNSDKIPFHPYYSVKDVAGMTLMLVGLMFICLYYPWTMGDPENFLPANPLVTPIHIQPEWYFLFAYAILRSIPNKLGGVMALAGAVMILLIFPLLKLSHFQSLTFYPIGKVYFWIMVNIVLLLTWIGARPVEDPYVIVGQILTIFYFLFFMTFSFLQRAWDTFLSY